MAALFKEVTFSKHVHHSRLPLQNLCYPSLMINLTFEYRKRPRTFLGAGLILISFLAALSISSAANKSVEVWAVSRSTSSGSALAVDNLRKIKVYLPENLSTYLPVSEKIAGKYDAGSGV